MMYLFAFDKKQRLKPTEKHKRIDAGLYFSCTLIKTSIFFGLQSILVCLVYYISCEQTQKNLSWKTFKLIMKKAWHIEGLCKFIFVSLMYFQEGDGCS